MLQLPRLSTTYYCTVGFWGNQLPYVIWYDVNAYLVAHSSNHRFLFLSLYFVKHVKSYINCSKQNLHVKYRYSYLQSNSIAMKGNTNNTAMWDTNIWSEVWRLWNVYLEFCVGVIFENPTAKMSFVSCLWIIPGRHFYSNMPIEAVIFKC